GGHTAFKDPPTWGWYGISNEQFRNSQARIVQLNDETFIAFAQRAAGGNPRIVPPMGVTLGMKDILSAHKMVLASDGGSWKQTMLRVMVMHEPTVEHPCTFVQEHPDAEVWVDAATAAPPPANFAE